MFEILKHFDGVPHAMHLRWRTRGKIEKNLCHPFRASHENADRQVFMMHNGTFMHLRPPEHLSDTHVFAEKMQEVTTEYGTDMLFNESFLRRVEKDIHSWNKVIFLRNDGKVAIMNPAEWHVIDGVWASNTYSFKDGYRKKELLSSQLSLVSSTKESKTSVPLVSQGGGKTSEWITKSTLWEKSRIEALKAEKEKATGRENDLTLSKKERRRARKERKRLELEQAEREALQTIVAEEARKHSDPFAEGRVVRRKQGEGKVAAFT
jgi:hypothetical protein